jgi:microcystin-dependent protein
MDEPYIGEIRPIGFDFAPKGWALCAGQQLPIAQNQALFSLLGTQFGGNGVSTFALPDLRGRVALGAGILPGGSAYMQGEMGGQEQVTLTQDQVPAHIHNFTVTLQTAAEAEITNPNKAFPAAGGATLYTSGPPTTAMAAGLPSSTSSAGGSQGHDNRQPYVALNFVIALTGNFPPRN